MNPNKRLIIGFPFLVLCSGLVAMTPFIRHNLVEDGAEQWWARDHADINGDGYLDFFVIHDNSKGGWLGWYESVPGKASRQHIIAQTGPHGTEFAAGDLASGDIDGDGDVDVLGPEHPGEAVDAKMETYLYWYENPVWTPHAICKFPDFIKDFDVVDLNGDGLLDIAMTSHASNRLIIYRQDSPDSWTKVADIHVSALHEGQHAGDLDGDGDLDVVATGFWFENPGGDMSDAWIVRNIDPYWNSDPEIHDWRYNATKAICKDIDGDGRDEVFLSCSECFRTRVAWYDLDPGDKDHWIHHEIGLNDFAHTLQVGDIDLDGDLDVLCGNNGDQGYPNRSPVILFFNQDGRGFEWKPEVLDLQGAYNSYLGDFEGDGDLDFFRYHGHDAPSYELWENQTTGRSE